jgi:hypothetical protein
VNGKAIAALRPTGSKLLDKLDVAVKMLRTQAKLIEKMGCPSPYQHDLEGPGWWSVLCIVQEQYKSINEALSAF